MRREGEREPLLLPYGTLQVACFFAGVRGTAVHPALPTVLVAALPAHAAT